MCPDLGNQQSTRPSPRGSAVTPLKLKATAAEPQNLAHHLHHKAEVDSAAVDRKTARHAEMQDLEHAHHPTAPSPY
nr:unnamed protein product [Digitaria exilis]